MHLMPSGLERECDIIWRFCLDSAHQQMMRSRPITTILPEQHQRENGADSPDGSVDRMVRGDVLPKHARARCICVTIAARIEPGARLAIGRTRPVAAIDADDVAGHADSRSYCLDVIDGFAEWAPHLARSIEAERDRWNCA